MCALEWHSFEPLRLFYQLPFYGIGLCMCVCVCLTLERESWPRFSKRSTTAECVMLAAAACLLFGAEIMQSLFSYGSALPQKNKVKRPARISSSVNNLLIKLIDYIHLAQSAVR